MSKTTTCQAWLIVQLTVFPVFVHADQPQFAPSLRIPVGTSVIQLHEDPARPTIYAIDRVNSRILFLDLHTAAVTKSLYVGKDPTSMDIDAEGGRLFVANKGPGTAAPGSYRIAVIDLNTQSKVASFVVPTIYQNNQLIRAVNVTAGRAGRLYYNAGFDINGAGHTRAMNAETGADLGEIPGNIKTMMVISSDKTRLFGQYIYDGNLGEMGVWDVSTDTITLIDSLRFSPYPFGWDYENYSLSADDQRLAYGNVLFNPANLLQQYGLFDELIYALNHDGSLAFGATSIWDTTTFAIEGDATELQKMPFTTTIMNMDPAHQVLYAFHPHELAVYAIERTTANGIPHRWLAGHGLPTNDAVEVLDSDLDGLSTLEEWIMDANPTNSTAPLAITDIQPDSISIEPASPRRLYTLDANANPMNDAWIALSATNGPVVHLRTDGLVNSNAIFRIRASVY